MIAVTLPSNDDAAAWRVQARKALAEGVPPASIAWRIEGDAHLLPVGFDFPFQPMARPSPRVPRLFLDVVDTVLLHRDPARFDLAYRLLWRLQDDPLLMGAGSDADVMQFASLAKSVRRDIHKMRAFVRFRRVVDGEGGEAYVAWFEPEHHIVKANAPFFANRFAGMRWSILTPRASAHWDGTAVSFGPGASRRDAPDADALENLWRRYYASIFNPARLKPNAMRREMAKKYWKNLPEAPLIDDLVRSARSRSQAMIDQAPNTQAKRLRPAPVRAESLADCRLCSLHGPATQPVAGVGPQQARLMIVGEQPGDEEDLSGKPFVGPAGQLLDRALARAGINRDQLFLTNAVKHFKFTPRGKRRIHQKPDASEIVACAPWLHAELDAVAPRLIVALGASAAFALTGKKVSMADERGSVIGLRQGVRVMLAYHPAYVLRAPDRAVADAAFERLVADLAAAARAAEEDAG